MYLILYISVWWILAFGQTRLVSIGLEHAENNCPLQDVLRSSITFSPVFNRVCSCCEALLSGKRIKPSATYAQHVMQR